MKIKMQMQMKRKMQMKREMQFQNVMKMWMAKKQEIFVPILSNPKNYWSNLQTPNLSKKVISRLTIDEKSPSAQSPITLIMKENKNKLISQPVLNMENSRESLQNLKAYNILDSASYAPIKNINKINLESKVLNKENIKGIQKSNKLNNFLRSNINYKLLQSKYSNYSIETSKLLKSFFVFNVFVAKSQNILYNFNKSQEKLLSSLESILNDTFRTMKALISRPVLEINSQKIIIQLFFFFKNLNNRFPSLPAFHPAFRADRSGRKNLNNKKNYKNYNKKNLFYSKFTEQSNNNTFLSNNKNKLELLGQILSKLLKKNVEFELIRLHYPVNETQILAKSIAILGNKIRRRFKYFVNASFKSANIINPSNYNLNRKMKNSLIHNASSSITGISMKLGGRILAQKIVPRFTSQTYQEGSLTRTNATIVTSSRFSSKNRKGAYSITVSMGHKFF